MSLQIFYILQFIESPNPYSSLGIILPKFRVSEYLSLVKLIIKERRGHINEK